MVVPRSETRMRLASPWLDSHNRTTLLNTKLWRSLEAVEERRVFRAISIPRYTIGGPRLPKHSIDPGSTHLSLGEHAEGLHFREAVTSRGRYLAPSYTPALLLLPLPLRFPLALMSS